MSSTKKELITIENRNLKRKDSLCSFVIESENKTKSESPRWISQNKMWMSSEKTITTTTAITTMIPMSPLPLIDLRHRPPLHHHLRLLLHPTAAMAVRPAAQVEAQAAEEKKKLEKK
ncbi:hypothetical protein SCA6_005031 [Theobroma cacao]